MDIDRIRRIKLTAIIALFSDDQLLELLVLKGGSAIELLHPKAGRSSLDLDFSIDGDLEGDVESLRNRFERLLNDAYLLEGFRVFDVSLEAIPRIPTTEFAFWGGYVLKFKVIESEIYDRYENRLERLQTENNS